MAALRYTILIFKEINETIKELKKKKNDYFLDNSKYIFEYFENKKSINNIEETNKVVTSKNQLLFNIFKVKQADSDKDKNINENKNKNLVQKYLSNIDESFLDINAKSQHLFSSFLFGSLISLMVLMVVGFYILSASPYPSN